MSEYKGQTRTVLVHVRHAMPVAYERCVALRSAAHMLLVISVLCNGTHINGFTELLIERIGQTKAEETKR